MACVADILVMLLVVAVVEASLSLPRLSFRLCGEDLLVGKRLGRHISRIGFHTSWLVAISSCHSLEIRQGPCTISLGVRKLRVLCQRTWGRNEEEEEGGDIPRAVDDDGGDGGDGGREEQEEEEEEGPRSAALGADCRMWSRAVKACG